MNFGTALLAAQSMYSRTPALLAAWGIWCLLHSLLATHQVKRLGLRLRLSPRSYRLTYVLFSTFSAGALFAWQLAVLTPPPPAGYAWQIIRLALGGYGLFMLAAGGRAYDMREFLGLAPDVAEDGAPLHFRRDGILGRLRHPWYSGGIALVVALGETPLARWDWRLLLIFYLLVGCLIEERRLVSGLGEVYRQYRREVPMLIPRIAPGEKKRTEDSP